MSVIMGVLVVSEVCIDCSHFCMCINISLLYIYKSPFSQPRKREVLELSRAAYLLLECRAEKEEVLNEVVPLHNFSVYTISSVFLT